MMIKIVIMVAFARKGQVLTRKGRKKTFWGNGIVSIQCA